MLKVRFRFEKFKFIVQNAWFWGLLEPIVGFKFIFFNFSPSVFLAKKAIILRGGKNPSLPSKSKIRTLGTRRVDKCMWNIGR